MSISGYNEEFALAMKTKLKLNRETRVKRQRRTASEPIPSTLRLPDRDAIIREVLAERPGLTREKLLIQMAALGF